MTFDPKDWYWRIGDQYYSSARNIMVSVSDPDYVAWMTPRGAARSVSDLEEIYQYVADILPPWLPKDDFVRPSATSYTKGQLKAYAAAKRYLKEIGGVEVGGAIYPSDRETQAKLTAAALFSQVDNTQTFTWKLADGSFTEPLTAAQMLTVAASVGGFVNRCFAAEAAIVADIESGSIISLQQIDEAIAAVTD